MRALGGPWSVVTAAGAEVCRYTDPTDACERACEDSRGLGRVLVVDGLRGPLHRGPLPTTARVVAVYDGGRLADAVHTIDKLNDITTEPDNALIVWAIGGRLA